MSSDSTSRTDDELYGYVPNQIACIALTAVFAISTIAHIAQASARKQWFLFPTVITCGVMEVGGWSCRLWSHYDPSNETPYKIQALSTILGPTPLLAANFIIFGRIIRKLGSVYSRLTPRRYTIIFCACDILSLFIQGGGGGVAASSDSDDSANRGAYIMLGGIVFQLVAILIYLTMTVEYIIRFLKDRPLNKIAPSHNDYTPRGKLTMNVKLMLYALALNIFFIFVRGVYRAIELSEGWHGPILRTEIYFNIFEGAVIVLALYTLNFGHPGWLLQEEFNGRDDPNVWAMYPLIDTNKPAQSGRVEIKV